MAEISSSAECLHKVSIYFLVNKNDCNYGRPGFKGAKYAHPPQDELKKEESLASDEVTSQTLFILKTKVQQVKRPKRIVKPCWTHLCYNETMFFRRQRQLFRRQAQKVRLRFSRRLKISNLTLYRIN